MRREERIKAVENLICVTFYGQVLSELLEELKDNVKVQRIKKRINKTATVIVDSIELDEMRLYEFLMDYTHVHLPNPERRFKPKKFFEFIKSVSQSKDIIKINQAQ